MAKLKCKLVSIYAPRDCSHALMKRLQEMSVIDIDTVAEDEQTSAVPDGFEKSDTAYKSDMYERFAQSADAALKILNTRFPEKKGLKSMLSGPREVTADEFYLKEQDIKERLAIIGDIEKSDRLIAEQTAEKQRLRLTAEQMKPWENLDVPLSFSGTAKTAAFIGTVSGVYDLDGLLGAIAERAPTSDVYGEVVNTVSDSTYIFICCPKSESEDVENALRELSFARPFQITSKTAKDKIASKLNRMAECEKRIKEASDRIKELTLYRRDIELFYDYCKVRADRYRTMGEIAHTAHTVMIKGYITERDLPYLEKTLNKDFTAVIEAEDADENLAPVTLSNNAFARPAETLVKMYSLPGPKDIDPTFLTGFFYYLFFGMMFSDAGYGLIMILATAFALKKLNPAPTMRQSLKLFNYCGISTFVWGLIYGSFFGDSIAVISEKFFGHRVALPALIDPMNGDAVTMLILSLILGLIEIIAGLCAKFVTCIKNGDRAGAFFDAGLWITTLLGLAVTAAGFLVTPVLKNIGIWVTAISVIGLVLTQGRDKKNPIARLFSGIISLYDITSYVSDLLSFSRLMALGLTTSAMSAVFNMLSGMGGRTVGGVIMLLIIFPLGHAINFGLNVLGAYVHTLRLQYVELFSKFYEGGGREFKTFTLNSKYTDLSVQNSKEEN